MDFVPHDSENHSLTKVYQGTEYYRRPRQVALDAFACRCPSLRPLFGNPTARSSHIAPYTFMKGSSLNAKAIATSEGIDWLNQRRRATQLTSRIPSKAQSCFGWTHRMRSHPRGEDRHRRCRYVEANTGEVKWGSCSSVMRHVDYAERVGQSDAYASSYDVPRSPSLHQKGARTNGNKLSKGHRWWCRSCSSTTSVWTRHHDSEHDRGLVKSGWTEASKVVTGLCKSERSSDL